MQNIVQRLCCIAANIALFATKPCKTLKVDLRFISYHFQPLQHNEDCKTALKALSCRYIYTSIKASVTT